MHPSWREPFQINLAQTTWHHRCKVSISCLYNEPKDLFSLILLFFCRLLSAAWFLFPPSQMYRTNNSSHTVEKKESNRFGIVVLMCVCWVSGVWQKFLTLNPEHLFLPACGDTCCEKPYSTPPRLTCWDPRDKQNKLLPLHWQLTLLTFPFSGPAELLCLWFLWFSSKHAGNRAILHLWVNPSQIKFSRNSTCLFICYGTFAQSVSSLHGQSLRMYSHTFVCSHSAI